MSERLVDKYASRGASLVHQLVLLEEERQPLPEGPAPAMLVTRVNERLIQASCAIEDGLLQVAVYLIGAAGFALTAIAHLHGERNELTRFKDGLIAQLDTEVAETLEESEESFAGSSPCDLLHHCFAPMAGACQAVAELEGVRAFPADDDSGDDDDLLDQIADSLWQTAVRAACAGQWLVDLHESE